MLKFVMPFAIACALVGSIHTASAAGICTISVKPSWADYCAKKAACVLPNGKRSTMCVIWRKIR